MNATKEPPSAWLQWAMLIGVWVVTLTGMSSPWGVLLLMWALPSLRTGKTYMLGAVERATQPLLFWSAVLTWVAVGVLLILVDVAPELLSVLQE